MSAASFLVRPGKSEDAVVLSQLGPATFQEAFGDVFPAAAIAERMGVIYAAARLSLDLVDPLQAWFLVEGGGAAIGFLALREGPPPLTASGLRPLEFARVYVRAAWHGRGPAFALMEAGFAEAQRRAADRLWLMAWERNPKALAFYRAHGFRRAGEVPVAFAEQELPHLVMTRVLPP